MANFGPSTTGAQVVGHFKDRVMGETSKTTITHRRSALLICITVLITGPSAGGIGAETAMSFAAGSPACILLAGRSLPKIQIVIDHISGAYPDVETRFISLDLSSQDAIREAATTINGRFQTIDSLINNAAIMASPFAKTADGIESQFGTNYIGHFLLTKLIMERLVAGQGARIINVSSSAHRMYLLHLDDWNIEVCRPWCRGTADETFHGCLGSKYNTSAYVRVFGVQISLWIRPLTSQC